MGIFVRTDQQTSGIMFVDWVIQEYPRDHLIEVTTGTRETRRFNQNYVNRWWTYIRVMESSIPER